VTFWVGLRGSIGNRVKKVTSGGSIVAPSGKRSKNDDSRVAKGRNVTKNTFVGSPPASRVEMSRKLDKI